MTDILGWTLEDALAGLKSEPDLLPVRIVETSGYRLQDDRSEHTDIRVVAVRKDESETVLITARF